MRLRRITPEMVTKAIQKPDDKMLESDGDTKFIRTLNGRNLQVIAFRDDGAWVVKSAWVRGEDDPEPLWKRIVLFLPRLLFKKR